MVDGYVDGGRTAEGTDGRSGRVGTSNEGDGAVCSGMGLWLRGQGRAGNVQ